MASLCYSSSFRLIIHKDFDMILLSIDSIIAFVSYTAFWGVATLLMRVLHYFWELFLLVFIAIFNHSHSWFLGLGVGFSKVWRAIVAVHGFEGTCSSGSSYYHSKFTLGQKKNVGDPNYLFRILIHYTLSVCGFFSFFGIFTTFFTCYFSMMG